METVPLKDLVTFRRSIRFTVSGAGFHGPTLDRRVVGRKHVPEDGGVTILDPEATQTVLSSRADEADRLRPGDVVAVATASQFRAGVVPEHEGDWYPASGVLAFGCGSRILPEVLAAFLNTPTVGERVKHQCSVPYRKSTVGNDVTPIHLGELLVPVPPLRTQQVLKGQVESARHLLRLRREQLRLHEKLCHSIVWEVMGGRVSPPPAAAS